MIEFRTLGGLDLRDAAGAKLSAILVHPKRTALLAYLAVAPSHGSHRRDTLLGLFWPELDQEHARASLRKAVHHLRRVLGKDALVGQGDEELTLADGVIWCDAAAFESALGHDDVPGALELYRGPFLQGFFVADAPEFERWMETQRARLRDRAFESAWRLAEKRASGGDAFGAAYWGRRATSLLPDDEGALRRLVMLLDGLGDRAGAVAAYDDFARRLLQDYDVEPSAETRTLIREIRARDVPAAAGASPPTAPAAIAIAPSSVEARDESTPTPSPVSRFRPKRLGVRRTLAMLAALIALATGVKLWRNAGRAAAASVSATSVAVFPFSFRGSAEYGYLAEGMASLLATALDGAGDLHPVDPTPLLYGSASSASRRDIASKLGAGLYVVGEVIEAGGRLRASATLFDGRDDARSVVRASAEDSASQLFGIVDRLAAQLAIERRMEPGARLTRVAAVTTHSLPALKAYLEGERSFRIGHYKEAVDAFQRAVEADSTFALAYYRLASAYSWSSDTMAKPAAARAVQFSERLSPPDRLIVAAFVPFVHGEADEAERRYRQILSTRPFEGEAWYPLGEVLFHFNPVRGRSIAEAKPMFERALNMGPKDPPLTHLLEIAAIDRDYTAFDTLMRGMVRGSHFDLVGRTVRAFTVGDEPQRVSVLSEIRATSDADLGNIARHMLFLLEDRSAAERVVRLLLEPPRPREVQALGQILIAHLEMSAGRRRAADSALARAVQLDRARGLEHLGLLHSMPFLAMNRADLEATMNSIEQWNADSATAAGVVFQGDQHLHRAFRSYVLGLLSAALRHHEGARRFAVDVERMASVHELAGALAHGVRARLAWEEGRPEAALDELQRARRSQAAADMLGIVPFYSLPQERFLRGEVLRKLERYEEAHGWYSAFDEHSPFGRVYLAPAHFRSAEVDEKLGRREEAASHYARFVELWSEADEELRPFVEEARRRLSRLRAEPR